MIGSLLDNDDFINVLHITRATAEDVAQTETMKKLDTAHEEYRPVMTGGSIHHEDESCERTSLLSSSIGK
jgi:hypothetical protein